MPAHLSPFFPAAVDAFARADMVLELASRPLQGFPVTDPERAGKQPIFIVGSGRSGNTLLRSMLVAGGEISIPPESYVLPKIIRKFATTRFASWDKVVDLVCDSFIRNAEFHVWDFDIAPARQAALGLHPSARSLAAVIDLVYATYARATYGRTLWGDKTPINSYYIPLISRVFPRAHFIHILRDPRASVASYVKAGLPATTSFADPYKAAAYRWKSAVRAIERLRGWLGPGQYHRVYYEDLVRNPDTTLRSLCATLPVFFEDRMLTFDRSFDSLKDARHYNHLENVGKPVDPGRVEAWRETISEDDIESIWRICGKTAISLGYS